MIISQLAGEVPHGGEGEVRDEVEVGVGEPRQVDEHRFNTRVHRVLPAATERNKQEENRNTCNPGHVNHEVKDGQKDKYQT